ncbi:sensor histidine kinase [Marinospirillum perlucidum]|uniref:sensor histidine kinase n=1 Tax=Marinospirillum perlucidum TaxID=1982602 RepID=UPI000DF1D772|nr:ATP-binding protein [Marinospirillum perlucidum]
MLMPSPSSLLVWGGLTLLACLGNYFPLHLLPGVDLLLGGVFIYLILLYWGLLPAFLAALPAYLLTWLLWEQPWSGLTHVLELIFVGIGLRYLRFRSLPLLQVFFWLLLGLPLSLMTYILLMDFSWVEAWMLSGKQAMNALGGGTLALILVYSLFPQSSRLGDRRSLAITDLFFYLPTLLLMLGSLLLVTLSGNYHLDKLKADIHRELENSQQFLAFQLQTEISQLHNQLYQANNLCQEVAFSDRIKQQHCYNRRALFGSFQQFFLYETETTAWSALNALSPRQRLTPELIAALTQARSQLIARQENTYQQLAGRGRLLIMRQVLGPRGEKTWLAGLVNLYRIQSELLSGSNHPHLDYLWINQEEPVLVDPKGDYYSPLPLDTPSSASNALLHWVPNQGRMLVSRWADSVFYLQTPWTQLGVELPGELRVELSPRQEQGTIYQMYGLLFTLAGIMMALGLVLNHWLAAWAARPAKQLVNIARTIPEQLKLPEPHYTWPATHQILEFSQLSQELQKMEGLLRDQFQRLQNKELRLENTVVQRTQELMDAHIHLQSVMDSMEAVLWSASLDKEQDKARFKLSYISPSVLAMTGYTAAEWLQQPLVILRSHLDPKQAGSVIHELQNMASRGRGQRDLFFFNPRDESWRVLSLRYWLVYHDRGSPQRVDGIILDITESHAAETKVKEQEQLLRHQARRAAMGEMVSNIAHQWRQPLNSLRLTLGNLSDAKEFGDLTEEVFEENLEQADKLINQMNQTVRDFVTFFRPRKQAESFNLATIVEKSVDMLTSSLQQVELEMDLDPTLAVLGYPNEIIQVILVLLQNAREAIKNREIDQGSIKIELHKRHDQASLTISDNAGGIPEDILSQIFDPYFTTKPEGSGIGLYMAKMVIEQQMHGSIQVENTPEGACFTLQFYLAEAAAAGSVHKPSPL